MLLHDVTRCFRRVFKKPYNIVYLKTLLLDAKNNKHPNKKAKKEKNAPLFFGGGGLKAYKNLFHFFPPKKGEVSKSSEIPIFRACPAKVGGGHFLQKRPILKGGDFERAKK